VMGHKTDPRHGLPSAAAGAFMPAGSPKGNGALVPPALECVPMRRQSRLVRQGEDRFGRSCTILRTTKNIGKPGKDADAVKRLSHGLLECFALVAGGGKPSRQPCCVDGR